LLSVTEHLKKPLSKNGLVITQSVILGLNGGYFLKTQLIHAESGEFIEDTSPILTVDNKPQSFGSALSYAKRYAKMTITGLTDTFEDDDAERASGRYQNPLQAVLEQKNTNLQSASDDKKTKPATVVEIVNLTSYVKSKGRTEAWLAATAKKLFGVMNLTELTAEQIEKIKSYA
jgi:hypothetical protein